MIVLADADSPIVNPALMQLAKYWSERGESVRLVRPGDRRTLWDGVPRAVYGSSIFTFAGKARRALEREWGVEVWGGTGVDVASSLSTVDASVDWNAMRLDYSIYPDFRPSIGFSQRGCRLRCGFCVVPQKEGKPRTVGTLASIWRGEPHKRWILLLDNDPFGQPREAWQALFQEAREGRFKLCFSQGINVRLIDDESAAALASIEYRDNEFQERRLYTAWDNLRDESVFKAGVARLQRAGIPAEHLMVYMLVGYRQDETWDDLWYRFTELVSLGCLPYPMPYDRKARPDLCAFERWVKRGLYRSVPWTDYAADGREDTRLRGTPARHESDAAWRRVVGDRLMLHGAQITREAHASARSTVALVAGEGGAHGDPETLTPPEEETGPARSEPNADHPCLGRAARHDRPLRRGSHTATSGRPRLARPGRAGDPH